MKVKNKILYHISRKTEWEIGQCIYVGNEDNPFWNKCRNCSIVVNVDNQNMLLHNMINNINKFPTSEQNTNFLYDILKAVSKEFSLYVREQTFEEVRNEYFPELPSRCKCLWVSEYEQLDYWKTMDEDIPRVLLTLELDGELFCADSNWLKANTFSSIQYSERAMHYWNGEKTDTPFIEYLFCGKAIIKDMEIV